MSWDRAEIVIAKIAGIEAGGDDRLAIRGSYIPDDIRDRIITLALDHADLSPRELAVKFTDMESYFVSEASVYRLLKAHDLVTSPAYIVIKANNEFKDKTTRPNEMWQTDFTYRATSLPSISWITVSEPRSLQAIPVFWPARTYWLFVPSFSIRPGPSPQLVSTYSCARNREATFCTS